MERLRKRSDFVAVAKGRRIERAGFVIQAKRRALAGGRLPESGMAQDAPARFGFTVTKKIGNSVVRNRIRRRLREVVRHGGGDVAQPGTDYVLMARQGALTLPFDRLTAELREGLGRVNQLLSSSAPREGAGPRPGRPTGPAEKRNSGT
jgi:ribonuclease P protein component